LKRGEGAHEVHLENLSSSWFWAMHVVGWSHTYGLRRSRLDTPLTITVADGPLVHSTQMQSWRTHVLEHLALNASL